MHFRQIGIAIEGTTESRDGAGQSADRLEKVFFHNTSLFLSNAYFFRDNKKKKSLYSFFFKNSKIRKFEFEFAKTLRTAGYL